ncbi:MAG: hypothetical protein HY238_16095, partial [Acidobacteria bacterium]|nr:hypothetical protein [Acidobacteriota bacterium]
TASVAVTLGNAAGSVTVTAVVSGLAPVTFNLTATAVTPAAPRIAAGGVVGGGLSSPPVRTLSPNAIVSVFGENFAPAGTQRLVSGADLVNGRLPTKLGGVCVQIGSEPARIFHVFPGQINLQVPTLAGSGNAEVQVIVNCGEANEVRSNPETVAFEAAAPEFFFFERLGEGRARVAAVNASRPGQTPRPGDVVTVYMTGLGLTDPAFAVGELPDRAGSVVGSLAVTLGGSELAAQDVLYAGVTPLLAGVYQLNIRIAAGRGGGDVPIGVRIGSASTPAGALVTLGP